MNLELVLDDPDSTVIPVTPESFLHENQDDEECIEALRAILAGEVNEVMFGGGSMPISILRKAE